MATKFLEPGGDADFGVALWPALSGGTAPVAATDFVHGGHLRSIQYAISSFSYVIGSGFATDAGGRVSLYLYVNAYAGAAVEFLKVEKTGDGSNIVSVTLSSTGVLHLATGDTATPIGTNGDVVPLNTWVRISLAWTITSTTVNQLRVFKDGVLSISATNVTLSFTGSADVAIGNNDGSVLFDIRTSDHYIDNSNALTDPGNIWVTAKRPNANGTTNGFTTQIGSGGSGYGTGHSPQVNERPLSTTNGWSFAVTGTPTTEEYNIEDKATGDINIANATIIDWVGWASMKSLTNETVSMQLDGAGFSQAITATPTLYPKVKGSTVYPSGTGADIGIQTSATVTTVSLFECGVLVAFIPSSTSNLTLLAAG